MKRPKPDFIVAAALVVLELLLTLPYIWLRPGLMRDDWEMLGRLHKFGAWHAAHETTASARPLVRVLYAGWYQIVDIHESLAYVLVMLLTCVFALCLNRLFRNYMDYRWAGMIVALWIVLPTHLTLDHWAATVNVTLSAILALIGIDRLQRFNDSALGLVAIGVLFAISVLLYEAIGPFVIAAPLVVMSRKNPNAWKKQVAQVVTPVVLVGAFVALFSGSHDRHRQFISPWFGIAENFGVVYETPLVESLIALIVVGAAVYVSFRSNLSRRSRTTSETTVSLGLLVGIAGIVPFLGNGYDAMFFGIGDRANYIASIGVVLCLVGLMRELTTDRVAVGLLVVLCLLLTPLHLYRGANFANFSRAVIARGDDLAEKAIAEDRPVRIDADIMPLDDNFTGLGFHQELELYLGSGWKFPAVAVEVDSESLADMKAE